MSRYAKLVRDKIPAYLDQKGITYEKHVATPEEYKRRLVEKLGEEYQEFSDSLSVEELADILEVVEALKAFPEYVNVEEVRKAKRDERGGFEQKIVLMGEK